MFHLPSTIRQCEFQYVHISSIRGYCLSRVEPHYWELCCLIQASTLSTILNSFTLLSLGHFLIDDFSYFWEFKIAGFTCRKPFYPSLNLYECNVHWLCPHVPVHNDRMRILHRHSKAHFQKPDITVFIICNC